MKRLCTALLTAAVALPLTCVCAAQAHLQLVDTLPRQASAKPPAESALKGYLLVYFKDETHALYFATSGDGYTFTDVNNGEPVLLGSDVAEQKGVRDPYLMRGPDNAFYMAMTDLHIYGREHGYRTTRWERPEEQYGWGNNQGLVLMRSTDLIHWTHTDVHPNQLFPAFADAGCVWAPEMIYDTARRQMMVYFTTRHGAGPNFMVYSYSNPAFTTLTTEPKTLFTYPKPTVNTIDGDITKVGSTYHLFYVAHDKPGNIRQATSTEINSGYVFNPQKIDPEQVAAEAPTLWRRNGTRTYVLMIDVFGLKPHNMGFSETEDFEHFRDIGHFNDPNSPMKTVGFERPKHGAVISLTAEEMTRLQQHFRKH